MSLYPITRVQASSQSNLPASSFIFRAVLASEEEFGENQLIFLQIELPHRLKRYTGGLYELKRVEIKFESNMAVDERITLEIEVQIINISVNAKAGVELVRTMSVFEGIAIVVILSLFRETYSTSEENKKLPVLWTPYSN